MKKKIGCCLLLLGSSLMAEPHYGRALTKATLGILMSGLVYATGQRIDSSRSMALDRPQQRCTEGAIALLAAGSLLALKDCGYDWAGEWAKKIMCGFASLNIAFSDQYHELFPQALHSYCVARSTNKAPQNPADTPQRFYLIRGAHAILLYELLLKLMNSGTAKRVFTSFDRLFERLPRQPEEDQQSTSDSLS